MPCITKLSHSTQIRAEYIADFHANEYMPVLAHKYLLVPDLRTLRYFPKSWKDNARKSGLLSSLHDPSDWLLVGKERFAMSGLHCNKIGVSHSAFRNQPDKCTNVYGR